MFIQAFFFFLLTQSVVAHSWIEQLALIGSNGSFQGAYGYPRGYVARTDPTFNGDSMLWLLPSLSSGRTRIDSSDLLCKPTQSTPNQSGGYPALQVAPGSSIAIKYLENGHVTLPQNQPGKPPAAGTVYVYGTTHPIADEKLLNVMQWNTEGTGGDKRGRLLAANNFDDGRCHQINGGSISTYRQSVWPDPIPGQPGTKSELWCETDVTLPNDPSFVKPGLALYWVWDWPTQPGAPGLPDGKDEFYTTCFDVDVQAQAASGPVSITLAQQDPMLSADADWASRTALTTSPSIQNATANVGAANTPAPTSSPVTPVVASSSAAMPAGALVLESSATPYLAPFATPSPTSSPLAAASPASSTDAPMITVTAVVPAEASNQIFVVSDGALVPYGPQGTPQNSQASHENAQAIDVTPLALTSSSPSTASSTLAPEVPSVMSNGEINEGSLARRALRRRDPVSLVARAAVTQSARARRERKLNVLNKHTYNEANGFHFKRAPEPVEHCAEGNEGDARRVHARQF